MLSQQKVNQYPGILIRVSTFFDRVLMKAKQYVNLVAGNLHCGGQHRAKNIVTFESDQDWYDKIKGTMPANVDLFLVSMDSPDRCVSEVNKILDAGNYGKFDVIIIDGLFRFQMIDIARKALADSGAIICDDADGYGFYEGFKDSGLNRVDFFGYAPGVILPRCSSIFFGNGSFLFDPHHLIPVIANE